MKPKVLLSWKVVKVLNEVRPIQHNTIFNISPNTGLYGQMGIPLRLGYIPQKLSPNVTYYQTIKKLLHEKWDLEITDKKFPFGLYIPNLGIKVQLHLGTRIFPPNILSITVSLSAFPVDFDLAKLIKYQRLDNLEPIADIVRWTIGLADTMDHRNFRQQRSFHFYPALNLGDICAPQDFQKHVDDNFTKYVGILIRNNDYELMDRKISDKMLEKNQEHNLKSSHELVLIDKQGILYLTPSNDTNIKSWKRNFNKVQELYEIAVVYLAFLRNYPVLRSLNEDLADFLLYKIQFLIVQSDMAFVRSVTHGHIWNLLSEEFRLKSTLDTVLRPSVKLALDEKSDYFDQFTIGWWEEKDFAYLITKKLAEAREWDLEFLSNNDLKRLITDDYGEARRSLKSKNYKATVVLCGSIVEAILTDIIDQAKLPGITTQTLYQYGLSKLIDIARNHKLINDPNLFSLLDPLRNYRNSIHPGVQIRKSTSIDSSTANIAIETVAILVKNLRHAQI